MYMSQMMHTTSESMTHFLNLQLLKILDRGRSAWIPNNEIKWAVARFVYSETFAIRLVGRYRSLLPKVVTWLAMDVDSEVCM